VEFAIDVTSPEHPYVQLAGQLREAIATGQITDVFPSLWTIVEETRFAGDPDRRVSYNTVRRAVKILKDEGLIEAIPGRGTFVRRNPG
jgi:DNA-binding GntR family transcriptional regulator